MDKVAGAEISQVEAWSDPIGAELTIDGQPADKAALAVALAAGDLPSIRFRAVVFKAEYPNANFMRFRDEDMPAFARSFGAQPFLRNHDTRDIGSRDGTIHSGRFEGGAVVEEVDLTTERGMKSFIEGQIDRFSIGWFFEGLTLLSVRKRLAQLRHVSALARPAIPRRRPYRTPV